MTLQPTVRKHRAVLGCGNVLYYESRSFVPRVGTAVPCLRHAYCPVVATSRIADADVARHVRARPRTRAELLAQLRRCPESTIAELRRCRFTLRLIVAAARDGLLDVDESDERARVNLRPERAHAS